jgi:D-alanyl-D-alanine dipeptidase
LCPRPEARPEQALASGRNFRCGFTAIAVSTLVKASSFFRPVLIPLGFCLLANSLLAAPIDEELVDIRKIDPTIAVELRYAGTRNIAGRALYPPDMPALVRSSVAQKLVNTQTYLLRHNYGLKIWDAYRPPDAQAQLWQISKNTDYVADPASGKSLHSWGVAVDCTLVDKRGREVTMPTDFDTFTPAAMLHYHGPDQTINQRRWLLRAAMLRNGFYGMKTEWWHYMADNWKEFGPILEVRFSAPAKIEGTKVQEPSTPARPRAAATVTTELRNSRSPSADTRVSPLSPPAR